MKIELKKIRHSEQLSEETHAFTANLYINGTYAGYAKNNGRGGVTYYLAKDEKGKLFIRNAAKFCTALPARHADNPLTKDDSWDMNLEQHIDDLLNYYLQKKELTRFNNKLNAAMLNGLVFGIPDQSFQGFAYPILLRQILTQPKGPATILGDLITKVHSFLTIDNKLLNTNIPESILKLGISGMELCHLWKKIKTKLKDQDNERK
jgi:hypothetical protein